MLWNGCKKSRRADIEDIETPQEFDLVRPYVMFLFLKDRMAMVNEHWSYHIYILSYPWTNAEVYDCSHLHSQPNMKQILTYKQLLHSFHPFSTLFGITKSKLIV